MESEHEEASVTLGISIPIDSSENYKILRDDADNQQRVIFREQMKSSSLNYLLDPNLGIMGQLPPAKIEHNENTYNPWNIDPHFLHTLPQCTSNSVENSILVVGGLNPSSVLEKIPPNFDMNDFVLGSSIFQYALDSGVWKYYGTMSEPRCYHACALDGHYLYITGGYSLLKRKHGEMVAISSTNRLNLIDRTWKCCSSMINSRAAHALVTHKGKLYTFGGRNSEGSILDSVEMYVPHQDFWFEITILPQPTMGLSATSVMDSVWVIGGITDHSSEDPADSMLTSVFSFVPPMKKWYKEVPLPYACAYSSCISNGSELWLVGGCTIPRNSVKKDILSCPSILKLSLSSKSKWEQVASLLCPRHAVSAVLYGFDIYVLGGVESSNKCASDKVEVINITRNVSTLSTRMPVPIAGCTSVLVVPEKYDYIDREDVSDAFSTFSETMYYKTGANDQYSESSRTSSTLEDIDDINRNKYSPPRFPVNDDEIFAETFPKRNEIPVIPEGSSFTERNKFDTDAARCYFTEGSKTSNTFENAYDVSDEKHSHHMFSTNQPNAENFDETFPKSIEIAVIPESSSFSERKELGADAANFYFVEGSKSSNLLEDVYDVNRKKHLPPMFSINQSNGENFNETFSRNKTSVTQKNVNIKDLFTSKVNELKAKSKEKIKCRTSIEIFLDSGGIGPYNLKKELPKPLKWLEHLKKFSFSDENLHKEVFQSKEPKLHIKTEVSNNKVNFKRSQVKYFGKDEKLDVLPSTCVNSCLPLQHTSFLYAKSNINKKLPNVNIDQNLEDKSKTTSKYAVISERADLELENLHNDASGETKIIIDENHFPVILLLGGEYSKKPSESRFILTYYCKEDMWNYACGKLPEYCNHHAAVFVNNKIFIIGGFRSENSKFNENITSKATYFDFCDNLWHNICNMNYPRAHHSAVVLKSKIYVLGGRDQKGQIISSVEVYDESSDIWKECESLPYPVLGAAAFSLNDSIHIFGGITYEDDVEIISLNTAIFNITKNNWNASFAMPRPIAFCGIANDLNSVWLFGGLTIEGGNLASAQDIYKSDIWTKTWTKMAKLSTPRLAPVTLSIGEKVYIIGGYSTQEKKETLTCELVDLTKNEVSILSNLPIGISLRAGVAITKICKTDVK